MIIVGIAILVCLGAFVVTQHKGYLRLAWQIAKYCLLVLIAAGILFVISRLILI
jgi:hypothetical protein